MDYNSEMTVILKKLNSKTNNQIGQLKKQWKTNMVSKKTAGFMNT